MIEQDIYRDFASRYDLSPGTLDQHDPKLAEFFSRLFDQYQVRSVLDCACGTGRHLLLFQQLGREVWGSDLSKAMLEQARQNLLRFSHDVPLENADYRDLARHFDREFDAVVCLGSIGYMRNNADFLLAFRSMYAVLREGGILILTTIITDKQWREMPRFLLAGNTPKRSRVFAMDYSERTIMYHVLDITHSRDENDLKVWSTELTTLQSDEGEQLLNKAGFRDVAFYGDFDFSPYTKESSERLIAVAQK